LGKVNGCHGAEPSENLLHSHINLLEIISKISYRFISSPPRDIDSIIHESLEKICNIEGVDRAYVFLFDEEFADNTHEWCSPGIEPLRDRLQRIPVKEMPWCIGQLEKFNMIHIPDVSRLPESSSLEKNILEKQGIKSILIVPMLLQGDLLGFLGFDSVREKKLWSDDIIRFLSLISDIIINAVSRNKMQENIIEANKNLKSEISKATKKLIRINQNLEEEVNERRQAEHKLLTREKRLLDQNSFILGLISSEAAYNEDYFETYRLITSGAADLIKTDRASIWLLNQDAKGISCHYYFDRSGKVRIDNITLSIKDNPIYFDFLLRGNIIKTVDAGKDRITASFQDKYFSKYGIKSILDCPIFLNNRVIGALCIESSEIKQGWSTEDINFVTSLAAIISLCIENRERQKAQKDLMESEIKYRQLFDGSVDSIFIIENEQFTDCNTATQAMFGCRKKEILGKTLQDLSPEFQPDGSLSREKAGNMIKLAYEGSPQVFEWDNCRPDGQVFNAEVSLKKLELHGKNMLQAVLRDITENKNLQKRLFTAQKLESLGKLAGGIAHDFNNILGIIMGYASILQPRISGDSQMVKYIDSILNESKRASELVSRLLAFSQGSSADFEPFDFHRLVNEISDIIKHTFDKNISFTCRLPQEKIIICGDYSQMHQVLMNIVLNSRDAMPNGGLLSIEASLIRGKANVKPKRKMPDGDFVQVFIKDTGIGMDKQTLDCIFDPFFTTKKPGKGTGLGLSAVYGIVSNHKGFIDVESEKDIGTIITLLFPLSTRNPSKEPVEFISEAKLEGKEIILIVDDEKEILNLSKDVFTMHGYRVFLANSGHEAVDIYRANKIDLVIMDMMMPKMSGNELYYLLREINPDIRVVISSGYTQDTILESILKEKNCRYIQKPFTIRSILSLVRAFLDEDTLPS